MTNKVYRYRLISDNSFSYSRKSNNPIIVTRLESLKAVIALLTRVGITALKACGIIIKEIF